MDKMMDDIKEKFNLWGDVVKNLPPFIYSTRIWLVAYGLIMIGTYAMTGAWKFDSSHPFYSSGSVKIIRAILDNTLLGWIMYAVNMASMRQLAPDLVTKLTLKGFVRYILSGWGVVIVSIIPFLSVSFLIYFTNNALMYFANDATDTFSLLMRVSFFFLVLICTAASILFFIYVEVRFTFFMQLALIGVKNPIKNCMDLTAKKWWRLFWNGLPIVLAMIAHMLCYGFLLHYKTIDALAYSAVGLCVTMLVPLTILYDNVAFITFYREKKTVIPQYNLELNP